MSIAIAAILGLVEGLTEFLPVSSTGHLILAGHFLSYTGRQASVFEVFIQAGAVLAVLAVYPQRFAGFLNFQKKEGFYGLNALVLLFCTTLPALVLGFLFHDVIKERLFNPHMVAIALIVGGLWIIFMERKPRSARIEGLDAMTWQVALAVGFYQCLAMWPGFSRSAATILGAMMLGVERKTAAEYSFFAAVPVLAAATLLDLIKGRHFIAAADVPFFALGFIVSFITAWVVIKAFIGLVSRFRLTFFGIYRIAIAALVFIFMR